MEFGIFLAGFVPNYELERDPNAEHTMIMNSLELAQAADESGFKYIWQSEHHFLTQYNHMSAPEVFLGYLAATTKRAHLGSAIFNPLPQVNHPARTAERVAMLDHLTDGRFEFGSGRGAGTHEITGFGVPNTQVTREIWDEVITEFPKMWASTAYSHEGKWFSMPERNVVPKPWKKPHPPMWLSASNPPTYEKAARLGLGCLGFFLGGLADVAPMVKTYKDTISQAEPVGAYVNDNVCLIASGACLEDATRARTAVLQARDEYRDSLMRLYHDTIPRSEGAAIYPNVGPPMTSDDLDRAIKEGAKICGDPEQVIDQLKRYEAAGVDQFGISAWVSLPQQLQLEIIRTFGKYVIPALDKDPVHRTTRFRESAAGSMRGLAV